MGGRGTWLEEAERELAALGHQRLPAGQRAAGGDGVGIGCARRSSVHEQQRTEEQKQYTLVARYTSRRRHCSKRGKIAGRLNRAAVRCSGLPKIEKGASHAMDRPLD